MLLPETAEPENTGATALGVLPATQGTESMLLIEQDEGLRKMISGILSIDGYTVSDAPTAEEAAMKRVVPQLIVPIPPPAARLDSLRRLQEGTGRRAHHQHRRRASGGWRGFPTAKYSHQPKPFALSTPAHPGAHAARQREPR